MTEKKLDKEKLLKFLEKEIDKLENLNWIAGTADDSSIYEISRYAARDIKQTVLRNIAIKIDKGRFDA